MSDEPNDPSLFNNSFYLHGKLREMEEEGKLFNQRRERKSVYDVDSMRRKLGRRRLDEALYSDSNFEFDNFTLDNIARKFYHAEAEEEHEAIAAVFGFAIEEPSLQDAIRAHGRGMGIGDTVLPVVSDAVAEQCRKELEQWTNSSPLERVRELRRLRSGIHG